MVKKTIFTAYGEAKQRLKAAGIEPYGFEARQIIRHITGYDNQQIMMKYNEQMTPLQLTFFNDVLARREKHYPLQYLLGTWSFYGLDFFVGDGVLIPRADTETLTDTALEFLKDKNGARMLDLCAGSGCIAISVCKNADVTADAVEKYDIPFEYLQKNIKKHDVRVNAVQDDVFSFEPTVKYDIIVSNPPYVSAVEMEEIDTETSFEPDTALYGGEDGLMFYRLIADRYVNYIKHGGMLAVEVGYKQARQVSEIFKAAGLENVGTKKDAGGIQRVVFGTVKNV